MRSRLMGLRTGNRLGGLEIVDDEMAQAALAGLWLRFDFLDESHRISQELANPTGSFWHAIMHRREGDFGNSKYWFRQVGRHSVFEPLRIAAREALNRYEQEAGPAPHACRFLADQASWDPFRFVDLCEGAVRGGIDAEALCRRVQECEWRLLFDDCFRRAVKMP